MLAQGGYYRLTYDTSACPTCMVKATYTTGKIPWIASPCTLKTALKNLPNMGDVEISASNVIGGKTFNITFTSSVGNVPELMLDKSELTSLSVHHILH